MGNDDHAGNKCSVMCIKTDEGQVTVCSETTLLDGARCCTGDTHRADGLACPACNKEIKSRPGEFIFLQGYGGQHHLYCKSQCKKIRPVDMFSKAPNGKYYITCDVCRGKRSQGQAQIKEIGQLPQEETSEHVPAEKSSSMKHDVQHASAALTAENNTVPTSSAPDMVMDLQTASKVPFANITNGTLRPIEQQQQQQQQLLQMRHEPCIRGSRSHDVPVKDSNALFEPADELRAPVSSAMSNASPHLQAPISSSSSSHVPPKVDNLPAGINITQDAVLAGPASDAPSTIVSEQKHQQQHILAVSSSGSSSHEAPPKACGNRFMNWLTGCPHLDFNHNFSSGGDISQVPNNTESEVPEVMSAEEIKEVAAKMESKMRHVAVVNDARNAAVAQIEALHKGIDTVNKRAADISRRNRAEKHVAQKESAAAREEAARARLAVEDVTRQKVALQAQLAECQARLQECEETKASTEAQMLVEFQKLTGMQSTVEETQDLVGKLQDACLHGIEAGRLDLSRKMEHDNKQLMDAHLRTHQLLTDSMNQDGQSVGRFHELLETSQAERLKSNQAEVAMQAMIDRLESELAAERATAESSHAQKQSMALFVADEVKKEQKASTNFQRAIKAVDAKEKKVAELREEIANLREENNTVREQLGVMREREKIAHQAAHHQALVSKHQPGPAGERNRRKSGEEAQAATLKAQAIAASIPQETLAADAATTEGAEELKRSLTATQQHLTTAIEAVEELKKSLALSQRYLAEEIKTRIAISDALQDERGNIRVCARLQPLMPGIASDVKQLADGRTLTQVKRNTLDTKTFEFDKVYGPAASQEEVFSEAMPLISKLLDGLNTTIFAYGQTGTGKTYTIYGNDQQDGLMQLAVKQLFHDIATARSGHPQPKIQVAMVEVFNQQLKDMLSPPSQQGAASSIQQPQLDVKMDSTGKVFVRGARLLSAESAEKLLSIIGKGEKQRRKVATNMNNASSRSHLVTTITVTSCDSLTGTQTVGKLTITDLAGSERVKRSGVTGSDLTDAININVSLTALRKVTKALIDGDVHVPYNDNLLTRLFADCLGGNSKSLMIVTLSPAEKEREETRSSMQYAASVREIRNGKAAPCTLSRADHKLVKKVKNLEAEVAALKAAQ